MAVLYSKEKGKLGTLTGSIVNWSSQLTSNDPQDPIIYRTLPAGYLRCDGTVYLAETFPELATVLGTGSNCRYKKPDTTLLDNQFQVPDLSAKSTKTSFSANLGDYQDTYLLNDAGQEITKSGVGLEVSSNIGATFEIQYQGNFFLPSQTLEVTGQPGFVRSAGNYTEETEVLARAFQPHAHFHDGVRSRTKSPSGEFSLFGRNSYISKSSLCIMPWANNTRQELCKAEASKLTASRQERVRSKNCLFGSETYTWFGMCFQGCDFQQANKCLIPANIPEYALPVGDAPPVQTGTLQFGCANEATGTAYEQQGYPIYIRSGNPPFQTDCGSITYTSEGSCRGGDGNCFPGAASCNNFSQIGNGPVYEKLDGNYFDTQVPFDSQPNAVSYGALNNVISDVEEFGNECIHKHFVPFNQDPHTFNVVTKPTYIPAGEISSVLNIDVNEENKADGYIQPFLVQEFLIKY